MKHGCKSWELGRSLEAVYIEAQRRLFEHLQQPTPEQSTWLEALLAEAAQQPAAEQGSLRQQEIAILAQMFTADDWQALAQTAAEETAKGIFQVRQREVAQAAVL